MVEIVVVGELVRATPAVGIVTPGRVRFTVDRAESPVAMITPKRRGAKDDLSTTKRSSVYATATMALEPRYGQTAC